MSSNGTDYSQIQQINFTGGFPDSKDLAPSVVFLVIYALSIPVMTWQFVSSKHRDLILIRPAIFLCVRLGMLGLRAYMSKNSYGESELIAELILVSIGYLFLVEPVVECWRRSVATAIHMDDAPQWVRRLSQLLKVGLLAAIGTAIAGSTEISGALADPDKLNTVKTLRKVSAVLAFAVCVILGVVTIATHVKFHLDARRTAFILPVDACLIVVATYKLVQTFSTSADDHVRTKAAFWILNMVFELLAYVALTAVSMPLWFPKNLQQEAEREAAVDVESTGSTHPMTTRK